jgi:hypothetical protein
MSIEILKPITITIQEEFCDYARKLSESKNWNRLNRDALLFEWYLKNRGIVKKELNWRHDFIYAGMKIDVKEINSKWFSIQKGKLEQYKESIELNMLSHFLFIHTNRDKTRFIKPGENILITPIALCDAKKIWKLAYHNSSDFSKYKHNKDEAFVALESIKTIGIYNV